MTLEELLMVTNESTQIDIVDAKTGELYGHGTPSDLEDAKFGGEKIYDFSVEDLMDEEVRDINVYGNRLTICIEVEHNEGFDMFGMEDDLWELSAGWAQ